MVTTIRRGCTRDGLTSYRGVTGSVRRTAGVSPPFAKKLLFWTAISPQEENRAGLVLADGEHERPIGAEGRWLRQGVVTIRRDDHGGRRRGLAAFFIHLHDRFVQNV